MTDWVPVAVAQLLERKRATAIRISTGLGLRFSTVSLKKRGGRSNKLEINYFGNGLFFSDRVPKEFLEGLFKIFWFAV